MLTRILAPQLVPTMQNAFPCPRETHVGCFDKIGYWTSIRSRHREHGRRGLIGWDVSGSSFCPCSECAPASHYNQCSRTMPILHIIYILSIYHTPLQFLSAPLCLLPSPVLLVAPPPPLITSTPVTNCHSTRSPTPVSIFS